MVDPAGDDDELAWFEGHVPVAEMHDEPAAHHEEELVLVFVAVPDELARELHALDVGLINLADQLRLPRLDDPLELLGEIDLLDHVAIIARRLIATVND